MLNDSDSSPSYSNLLITRLHPRSRVAPKGRPVFRSIFDHQNRSFEWRDILFGSHILVFLVTFQPPKSFLWVARHTFWVPILVILAKSVAFWTILGTRKVCFTTQRNHFHEYFWTHFWPDGRTDGRTDTRTWPTDAPPIFLDSLHNSPFGATKGGLY